MAISETFNLSDYEAKINRAMRMIRLNDKQSTGAINFLVDMARKQWRVTGELTVANQLFGLLKSLKNPAFFKKFTRDFPAFCGYHGTYIDKAGNAHMTYMPTDEDTRLFTISAAGFTPASHGYEDKRAWAMDNAKQLIAHKILFWNLKIVYDPTSDATALAKKRYVQILKLFSALRDTTQDWQDSEDGLAIAQALHAMSEIVPALRADYIEEILKDAAKVAAE